MKVSVSGIFVVVGFAFIASVSSDPFIEEQDASLQDVPAGTNVKRWHNWYCYTVSHKSLSYPCYLVLQKRAGMARCENSRLHHSVSGSVTGLDFISGLTL